MFISAFAKLRTATMGFVMSTVPVTVYSTVCVYVLLHGETLLH